MTVYLLGSPNEKGNELFLESQEVLDSASSGVAVYASINNPSDHLLTFLCGDEPVAYLPHEGEKWFVDKSVRSEIESLLP